MQAAAGTKDGGDAAECVNWVIQMLEHMVHSNEINWVVGQGRPDLVDRMGFYAG